MRYRTSSYATYRFGHCPSKTADLAKHAWGDAARGDWPPIIPKAERIVYDLPTIKRWFAFFLERFFAANHFKTSALPNGLKIGSGGSLSSPCSDWRPPSDASATAWLDELHRNTP